MFKRLQGLPSTLTYCSFDVPTGTSPQSSGDCAADQRSSQTLQNSSLRPYQLQQTLTRRRQLRQVECKIRRTLDLSSILGTAVVEVATLFDAHQVALIQSTPLSRYRQTARYCRNQETAWRLPLTFAQADFPSLLEQLWQGQPIRLLHTDKTTDRLTQPSTLSRDIENWRARWSGSWLLIPVQKCATQGAISLKSASQHWGIFALALEDNQDWSEAAIADVQSIALELSTAIAHGSQYQELLTTNRELQKLALSDGLTSLANRRRFDEYVEGEWQRLSREQQPLSLILCDIDRFKLFNDTFGHPAGDRCLIHIARALLKVPQRPADLVARYGGEEFAIVLPNTDTQGAWRIAQNIHDNIEALRIAHADSNIEPYVTVTMGVSTIIPGQSNTTQTLVQASDIALYYAKQQGRNRTYINGHHNTVPLSDVALLTTEVAVSSKLKLTPSE